MRNVKRKSNQNQKEAKKYKPIWHYDITQLQNGSTLTPLWNQSYLKTDERFSLDIWVNRGMTIKELSR